MSEENKKIKKNLNVNKLKPKKNKEIIYFLIALAVFILSFFMFNLYQNKSIELKKANETIAALKKEKGGNSDTITNSADNKTDSKNKTKADYVYVITQPLDENDTTQGVILAPSSVDLKEYLDLYKPSKYDFHHTIFVFSGYFPENPLCAKFNIFFIISPLILSNMNKVYHF